MSREPHGFVVIPRGKDGEPTGVALWESDPDAAAQSFCSYPDGGAYLMQMYRPAEVEVEGGAHAAEQEAPCPPKSSSAT